MKTRVSGFLKRHKVAIFIAIFVACLYGAHHVIMPKLLEREGLPYYPTLIGVDEKYHTIAKSRSVYYTGWIEGDVSLAEHEGEPPFLPPLPHLVMGYLGKLSGSMTSALVISDFIFPALTFILLYLLAFEVSRRKLISIFFASLSIILPRYLVFFPFLTKYYLAWFLSQLFNTQGRLYFNRFEDPLLTVPFFILALYLIVRTVKRNEKVTPYLAAAAYGLLFYAYFYYYVYLSVALGIMLAIFLLKRELILAKRIGIVIVGGLIISIPYWINFLRLRALPAFHDLTLRLGPEHGYAPMLYPRVLFAYIQHTVLALIAYFFYRNRGTTGIIFMSLLLPVFVVYNIQMITGFNPQPDHWVKPQSFVLNLVFVILFFDILRRYAHRIKDAYVYTLGILALIPLVYKGFSTEDPFVIKVAAILSTTIVLGMAGYAVLKHRYKFGLLQFGRLVVILAVIFLMGKGVVIKREYIRENLYAATLPSFDDDSINWLQKNALPGEVVGTTSFLTATYIKHFTHNKLLAPDGIDTLASNAEIMERFMTLNSLYGVSPQKFGEYFATEKTYPPKDEDHEGISFLFGDQYRAVAKGSIFTNKGFTFPAWSNEEHQKIVSDYENYLKAATSSPYRIDYLYYGPREKVWSDDPKKKNPSLEKVFERNSVTIYKFKK